MSPTPTSTQTSSDELLATGTRLDDRFELCECLGAGGFGYVYRARQLVLGQPVREIALKLFRRRCVPPADAGVLLTDALTLIGLLDEDPPPEVARRVAHVYDAGITRAPLECAYVAMRLVRGRRSLGSEMRRFRRGGMPVETSLWYLQRLLVPLAWMHGRKSPLVHGDIKPENVLLTEDHDVVLTDFGLAARMPLGAMGGTVPYEAPEVLAQAIGGPASDVYSLGVLWYEMLTGHSPFEDVGLEALAAAADAAYCTAHHEARKREIRPARDGSPADEAARIPPASECNAELRRHPQLEAMLVKCLAYSQSQRYANAGLLLADLSRYTNDRLSSDRATRPLEPAPVGTGVVKPVRETTMSVPDALALIDQGRAEEALTLARALIARDGRAVPALLAEARALTALGHPDKAQRSLFRAQELAPDEPEVLELYADALAASGQQTTALALRRRATALRGSGQRVGRSGSR